MSAPLTAALPAWIDPDVLRLAHWIVDEGNVESASMTLAKEIVRLGGTAFAEATAQLIPALVFYRDEWKADADAEPPVGPYREPTDALARDSGAKARAAIEAAETVLDGRAV